MRFPVHRNNGFLYSGTAVSSTPDCGVTEPGIFNVFMRRYQAYSSMPRLKLKGHIINNEYQMLGNSICVKILYFGGDFAVIKKQLD